MHFLALSALVSAAFAQKRGFNYGATTNTGAVRVQQDFENEFNRAKNLQGQSGFTSARLYTMIQGGTPNTATEAIPAAINTRTTLLLGLWGSAGQGAFDQELTALSNAIKQYGSSFTDLIDGISIGSEDLYRITPTGIENNSGVGAGPDVLVSYINQVRDLIKGTAASGAKIGHVDTWTAWVNGSNTAVINAVDWLGMDGYPYYQTTQANSIANGAELFFDSYNATVNVAGGKPVWITETGWPYQGPQAGQADASIQNAETYWQAVACRVLGNINTWWFTLNDPKANNEDISFSVVGPNLNDAPLYNLACSGSSNSKSSVSSSSAKPSSTAAAPTMPAVSSGAESFTINTTPNVESAPATVTGVGAQPTGAQSQPTGYSMAAPSGSVPAVSSKAAPSGSVPAVSSKAAPSGSAPAASSMAAPSGSAPAVSSKAAPSGSAPAVSSMAAPSGSAPAVAQGGETHTVYQTTVITVSSCPVSYVTICPASCTASTPAPSMPAPSSYASAPSMPAPSKPAPSSSAPASSMPAPSKPAPSSSAPASSMPSPSKPAPSSSAPASSMPAPSKPAPSSSAPASSMPAPSSSAPAPSSSAPAPSSCPATLTGDYQYPHLMVPVSSSSPNKAYGTSYNGTITPTQSVILNFDIPTSYAGKTCSLVFLFPNQKDLQTTAYSFNGKGGLKIEELSGPADAGTTYANAPKPAGVAGSIPSLMPGNSYTVFSHACGAGQRVAFEFESTGGLELNFFQDYNPSPLGAYITSC